MKQHLIETTDGSIPIGRAHLAYNARSRSSSTPRTCPNGRSVSIRRPRSAPADPRRISQFQGSIRGGVEGGFFQEWQGKRMIGWKKKGRSPGRFQGFAGTFSRPDLAIPCWVASPQSPTLFHQAALIIARWCRRIEQSSKTGQSDHRVRHTIP
jgi:hypothetical protein